MSARPASIRPTKTCPEGAGGPCVTELPDQIEKEEPKAVTCGLKERQNSELDHTNISEKPRVGNKDSELGIPRCSTLVDELESDLNQTRLRDGALGIRPGETVSGTLHARNAGVHWRFLDEDVNFIEPGSSYHGEFIARVVKPSVCSVDLALIGWRPAFGKPQEYVRFAQFSRKTMEPIQLPYDMRSKLGLKVEDMVEFVARVTVYNDFVEFQIPIARLKPLHNKYRSEG